MADRVPTFRSNFSGLGPRLLTPVLRVFAPDSRHALIFESRLYLKRSFALSSDIFAHWQERCAVLPNALRLDAGIFTVTLPVAQLP
jgi:hypothetical protein